MVNTPPSKRAIAAVAKSNPARGSRKKGQLIATPEQRASGGATRSTLFVNSVEKAMRVLTAFDGTRRQLTLSQIASLIEMDISAAQRFTYTLTNLGYLRKDELTKTYELSPKAFDFAYHYLASSDLVHRGTPYLHQLSIQTEEATNISVLDGTDIVFVMRIVSRHVLNPAFIVGARLPAYCTAPGLAMLAYLPSDESDRILKQTKLVSYTPHTVHQIRAIKSRLAAIRANGYAHTEQEYFLGDISTAAPILDTSGKVLGAINVAVAKPRWRGGQDERGISELVMAAASAISGRR